MLHFRRHSKKGLSILNICDRLRQVLSGVAAFINKVIVRNHMTLSMGVPKCNWKWIYTEWRSWANVATHLHTSHLSWNFPHFPDLEALQDFNIWICPLLYSITCRITMLFPPCCLNIFNTVLATSPTRDHTDKTAEWRCTNIDFDFMFPLLLLSSKNPKNAMQNKKLHNACNTVWWCKIAHHRAFSSHCSNTVPLKLNITFE